MNTCNKLGKKVVLCVLIFFFLFLNVIVSLMNSNTDEFEELIKDPDRLYQYLGDHIDGMYQALHDDENFCKKDIDGTKDYIIKMEKKFFDKFRELENQLEQIRKENEETSEENQKKFDNEIEEINRLFTTGKHHEAWEKFQICEKNFEQRSRVIERVPKLNLNETDIDRYFSANPQRTTIDPPPLIQSTITTPTTTTTIDNEKQDSLDKNSMTWKEEKRSKKVIENLHISKDNEELNTEKTEQTIDNSQFGIRSNQQKPITNGGTTTNSSQPKYCFSTRLGPNLPFSGRNISSPQDNRITPDKKQSTLNSTNSISPQSQQFSIHLTLNPVSHYQHDRNKTLLMACNYRYIVLFKSQRNRLDLWDLGAIERGTQSEHSLEWHDGLIISMGSIENDFIYMFTEGRFLIYSISKRRTIDSRILPRGNDDGLELNHQYHRGIGIVDDKHWYHIYINRSSNWILSKNLLDQATHINDLDLTRLYPDVIRFIHLTVNKNRFHFLVQMSDSSYAVVCDYSQPIILLGAKQPLTIYSGYSQTLKDYIFFINDPLINTLHIITNDRYIQAYSLTAYAIYYLAEKNELMIVTDTSISSININKLNLVV